MKLWSLTHNIVKINVYMNCHDMFTITITQTWYNMNCHCLITWYYLKTISNLKIMKKMNLKMIFLNSFLRYIRYKLNHSTCLHENKITRYLLSQWKILRKLSNQNHMLIHIFLYLKNITIWLMFLKDKKLTNWYHIRKNMTSELIWNQKKLWILNLCTACYKRNCKCYNNILMSILQKNSFSQVIFHLCFWYYS